MEFYRVVCQFSCGATSAVATKLALAQYGHERVAVVNAFLREEHEDNRRFFRDCEAWFEHAVIVLRDEKYGASAREVFRRKRFIKGPHGAPCSQALKRELLGAWSRPDDAWVIGYTADEHDRIDNILDLYPDRTIIFPLVEKNLTKSDCLSMLDRAGIELPMMYRIGFDNANCKCCPKGGQNYHMKCRNLFPSDHAEMIQIQRDLGPGSYFLQHRSGPKKGERMPLWELPEGDGNMADEPSFSCSFFCQMAEQDIQA